MEEDNVDLRLYRSTLQYTRRQINQDRMIFGDFSVNSKPIILKAIFYSNPNSPENFVKLYSVFQKLDHLTCNELELCIPL